MRDKTVCIVGLGYVGLPLAKAFSKHLKPIGFDIDEAKIRNLGNNTNNGENIEFTTDPSKIKQADFVIIAVPTPVTKSKEPDLSYVKSAAETVGKNLKQGATVVLESTVYPGVTEEVVAPILERINPGDEAHEAKELGYLSPSSDPIWTSNLVR
jgi:UDPglucose 6-dehydrogenase/UDP-N-acetyl-D-galactosamine dehydrogenase